MGCIQSKAAEQKGSKYLVKGEHEHPPHGHGHPHRPSPKDPSPLLSSSADQGPTEEVLAPKLSSGGNIVSQPSKRAKLDPLDFQFVGLRKEVRIKEPGTIKGQAFMIDNCEDCDLYILDYCGQVTIDDCKNCRIFIGPCEGSVFLRTCSSCNFAVVCRQLRTRDITDCNISLLCRTRPIVESSTNVGFACFDLNYQHFDEHLAAVKMSPLHNFWYYVFDFTPKEGSWRLLPPDVNSSQLLAPIPPNIATHLGQGTPESGLLVTWGDRDPRPDGEYIFVVFASVNTSHAMDFARAAAKQGQLLRCNQAKVSAEMAGKMASEAKWSRSVEREMTAEQCIGVELVCPADALPELKKLAHSLHGHHTDSQEAATLFRFLGIDG